MALIKHTNTGKCPKCAQLFDLYPGFHEGLRKWFETLQLAHPEAHIACAGRGEKDQEAYFEAKASKAHYGQSAHNYNAAIDIFKLIQSGADYSLDWFKSVVGRNVVANNADPDASTQLEWYGRVGAAFFELPHVEVSGWKALATDGKLSLVEPKK